MPGGLVESLKKLLSASKGREDGGQEEPQARLGKPPRPPPRLHKPQAASGPQQQHQQPGAAQQGNRSGRRDQELGQLRSQFHELQQRLARLPAQLVTPAAMEQQLLQKLHSGRPPGSPASEPSAAEGEKAPQRQRRSSNGGKEEALLKLSKLSRQRVPSSKAQQELPPQQQIARQSAAAVEAQAAHALARAERALCKPKVQQAAAARVQRRGGAGQAGQEGQARKAVSPTEALPAQSSNPSQSSSPQPPSQLSPPAKGSISVWQQATLSLAESSNPRRLSREELPADLLPLRDSVSHLQRVQPPPGSRAHSQQEQLVLSRRGSREQESRQVRAPAAPPASEATGRLLGVVRGRECRASDDQAVPPTASLDPTGPVAASSSTAPTAASTEGASQQRLQPPQPQQLPLIGSPAPGASAAMPATQGAEASPAPRSAARQRSQGSGPPAKSSRPSPAMLRQQAAWGSLAGLSLEEMLATKGPSASTAESQEDQENLPSPKAKSRRAGSPATGGPLRDSPLSPAAPEQQARRKTEPAMRAVEEEDPVLHHLQRLHTDGHAATPSTDVGQGIKWGRPPGHRLQADASTASIGSAEPSALLEREGSWEPAAAPAEPAAADAAPSPQQPVPAPVEQSAGSAATESGARRRRAPWNFGNFAMSAVPEHAAVESPQEAGVQPPLGQHQQWQSPGSFTAARAQSPVGQQQQLQWQPAGSFTAAGAQSPVGQQQQWQSSGSFKAPWRTQLLDISGGGTVGWGPHHMASLQRSFSAVEPHHYAAVPQQLQQPGASMHRQSLSDSSAFGYPPHRQPQSVAAEVPAHTVLPALHHGHHNIGWQHAHPQRQTAVWAQQPAAHGPVLPPFVTHATGAQVLGMQHYGQHATTPAQGADVHLQQHRDSLPPLSRHHMYPY